MYSNFIVLSDIDNGKNVMTESDNCLQIIQNSISHDVQARSLRLSM